MTYLISVYSLYTKLETVSDIALLKALYLATFEATKRWTSTIRNYTQVYGELSIMYKAGFHNKSISWSGLCFAKSASLSPLLWSVRLNQVEKPPVIDMPSFGWYI